MKNQEIDTSNTASISQVSTMSVPPKWLLVVFKIYGGILVFSGIFSFVFPLDVLMGAAQFFVFIPVFAFLMAVIITGIGSWYLKRWVIFLLLVLFISGLVGIFVFGFKIDSSSFGTLISIFLLILAYRYRQHFSGSYKNYIIQTIVIVALVTTHIGLLYPATFSRVSEADIDAYIQNQNLQNFLGSSEFQNTLKMELTQQLGDDQKAQQILNEFNEKLKQNPEETINALKNSQELRTVVRMILETESNSSR